MCIWNDRIRYWLSAVCLGGMLFLPVGNLVADLPKLVVSPDGRSFLKGDEPFIWLGDDAWGLFTRLSLDSPVLNSTAKNEVEHFLMVRRDQGFSVIHTWLATEWMNRNRAGHAPFLAPMNASGPVVLNESYFDHVVEVIELADQYDLYITIEVGAVLRSEVPEWWLGGFDTEGDGKGDSAADHKEHVEKSYEYGWQIANALKRDDQTLDNLVWGLGQDIHPLRGPRVGEHNASNNAEWFTELVRAMAEGIADGTNGAPLKGPDGEADYSTTLMSFHPGATRNSVYAANNPGSSAKWFHSDPWLDFNSRQSGRRFLFNDAYYHGLVNDYGLKPTKPVFEMEGGYESGPVAGQSGRVFRDYHVRLQAYWTMLSGGFGYGYGHGSVYPFSDGVIDRGSEEPIPWMDALQVRGGSQLAHLRHLFEARPFSGLVPDHAARKKLLITEPGSNFKRIVAARSRSGRFGLVYTTNGRPFDVDLSRLSGRKINATWFNPRTGETSIAGVYKKSRRVRFDPPGQVTSGDSVQGNDWVLVLDDAGRVDPIVVSSAPSIDVLSLDVVHIPEAGSRTIDLALGAQPAGLVEVTIGRQGDDPDLLLAGPTILTFRPDNWDTVQSVLVSADNDTDTENGKATLSITAPGYRQAEITIAEVDDDRLIGDEPPLESGIAEAATAEPVTMPGNNPPVARADRLIVIEAEDYDENVERGGHRWHRDVVPPHAPTGYSGGAALRVVPEDHVSWRDGFTRRAPEISYDIDFASSGAYTLWVRSYAFGGGSNSFHAGLNGRRNDATTNVNISPYLTWVWVQLGTIKVPKVGRHTLNVWARETGTVIDQLVLSQDPAFTP